MKLKLLVFSLPNCYKCNYFLEHPQHFEELAQCKKFKVIYPNNISTYETAENCRKNENKCGIKGKEYLKNIEN